MGDEQMMTRKEVAAFLRTSIDTVRRMELRGTLTAHRDGKRLVRYLRSDVLTCMPAPRPPVVPQ